MIKALVFLLLSTSVAFAGTRTVKDWVWPAGGSTLRNYVLYVPANLVNPPPLVVMLHGSGGDGAAFEAKTGMDAVADANGFIVLYPSACDTGPNNSNPCPDPTNSRRWYDDPQDMNNNDITFIKWIVQDIQPVYNIDRKKRYGVGHSEGVGIIEMFACAWASDMAAFVDVAQNTTQKKIDLCNNPQFTKPGIPMPAMFFHGTADQVSRYDPYGNLVGAEATANYWRQRNACADPPSASLDVPITLSNGSNTTGRLQTWSSGCTSANVQFYKLEGAGHGWPGATYPAGQLLSIGPNAMNIDASQLIWNFLKNYARP